MDDPTGLAKILEASAKVANSKLVIKSYDHLLAEAMKEGGEALADSVKAFRLFTAPLQLLAVVQDRLAAFCERVRKGVPKERQQEAPPSIALPVMLNLRFMEDDNPLTTMYLELLKRAIDKDRCDEAHPAFAKIIEQLSPDEAMLLYLLREIGACKFDSFPSSRLTHGERLTSYTEHLSALSLVSPPERETHYLETSEGPRDPNFYKLSITEFGGQFIIACIPDDFTLPTKADE